MSGLIEELLIQSISDEFSKWALSGGKEKFSSSYFLKHAPKDVEKKFGNNIRKKSGYWAAALVASKINPDCFVSARFKKEENKRRLIEAIKALENTLGTENLNDRSMNDTEKFVDLPRSLLTHSGTFELSEKYNFVPTISLAAFQRRCFTAFGDWDTALLAAGVDLHAVKRKVASHSLDDLLNWFDSFIESRNNLWTVTTIRDEDHALFKALGNNAQKKGREKIPTSHLSDEYVFNMWVYWKYWKKFDVQDFSNTWFEENEQELKAIYDKNHRAQERWSIDKIQIEALSLFAKGGFLGRDDLASSSDGRRLLATLRSEKFGGGLGEAHVLNRVGIQTESLRNLKNILEDISLEDVLTELRALVGSSIERRENLLSREKMQRDYFDLFSAAIRWYNRLSGKSKVSNDWSKTLSFFGLNPAVFELTASKRARRGAVFQRFFEQFALEEFEQVSRPEDVVQMKQVCCNKSYSKAVCSHEIRCKPDFVFQDLIIDTKVGGALAKKEQLERYLDHSSNVLIVSINDKPKSVKLENGTIKIVGFSDFIEQSKEILGVSLRSSLNEELSEVLKTASIFSIAE